MLVAVYTPGQCWKDERRVEWTGLTDPFSASVPRAKDMKNKLGIFRRRNESPGAQPTGKTDKVMKSFK